MYHFLVARNEVYTADTAHLCVRLHLYILYGCTRLARRTQVLWHLQRKVALSVKKETKMLLTLKNLIAAIDAAYQLGDL